MRVCQFRHDGKWTSIRRAVGIAQKSDVDLFFLRPCFLGEGIVAADAINFAIEVASTSRKPLPTPHSSVVHVPVKAIGKKSNSVFLLPKFSLNRIGRGPSAVLVGSVKSGALLPTARAIGKSPVKVDSTIEMRPDRVKIFAARTA